MPDGEITMSVGYEQLRWEEGKVIVFDDTYIHQAQVHLVSRCVPVLMATDPSKDIARLYTMAWNPDMSCALAGSLQHSHLRNLWMCHPCDSQGVVPEYCGPPGAMLRLGLQPCQSERQ